VLRRRSSRSSPATSRSGQRLHGARCRRSCTFAGAAELHEEGRPGRGHRFEQARPILRAVTKRGCSRSEDVSTSFPRTTGTDHIDKIVLSGGRIRGSTGFAEMIGRAVRAQIVEFDPFRTMPSTLRSSGSSRRATWARRRGRGWTRAPKGVTGDPDQSARVRPQERRPSFRFAQKVPLLCRCSCSPPRWISAGASGACAGVPG